MLLKNVVLHSLVVMLVGLFTLTNAQAQPANDAFANAWTLSGAVVTTNGLNTGASKETGEPAHAGNNGGRSVWFNWTAPASGQVRLSTTGSTFNTLLAVYTGNAVNTLTPIASANGGSGSTVQFQANQGTTYRIAIDARRNFGLPNGGSYILSLRTLATLAIASPTNGAAFTTGTPIPITVTGEVPTPPIVRVDFYRGGVLFDSDTNAPYSATANNVPAGTNSLFVVAVDGGGLSWTSSVVNIGVLNAGITIVSPAAGSVYLDNSPISVSVVASLPSGSITNVEFLVDGQKFAEDNTAPFAADWTSVTGGKHRFTALGKDDSGNVYFSNPVNFGVAESLVPLGAVWSFLDDGSDQGTAWRMNDFDDSKWSSGPGEFGYGDGDEATLIGFGPDPNNKYITTYFRRSFVLTNIAGYTGFLLGIKRDDGAVVYLNGNEAGRYNIFNGVVNYQTLAQNAGDDGATLFLSAVPSFRFVEGTNLLAVEIHQNTVDSTDISFDLELRGIPLVTLNQSPAIALTSPTNNANFLGPVSVLLEAAASDSDGSVAKVEFFVDGLKIGESTSAPYSATWTNPTLGTHQLVAIATDNEGASQPSAAVKVNVYDAAGHPVVQITAPADGTTVEGPTNLLLSAVANALNGVTNIEFFANGLSVGNVAASPFVMNWAAPFGSNALTAMASDASGTRGTSAVVYVVVTIPPTNTVAPTIVGRVPAANTPVTSLTSIRVTFSERVLNVDASDLLINGVGATNVTWTGTNYIFTFPQPAYGMVSITWASDHGITDIGFPSNLPFDATAAGATWVYNLLDFTAPTIVARNPAANATVSNLSQISITFSEPVTGVDASDLLINGSPAFSVSGSDATYAFNFSQPAAGLVSITWAASHGIKDLSASANAFNATGSGATWAYTLDNRSILVQTNSVWKFVKGTAEASSPSDAWRQSNYDDSSWSNAPAPFYFGDNGYTTPQYPGTQLFDMANNGYVSIYMRIHFVLPNASAATNLFLVDHSDDGYIAWINGVEVARYNLPPGDMPYNGSTIGTANEPNNNGAAWLTQSLPDPSTYLVDGTNVLTVHAFNAFNQQNPSSDFGIDVQLYTFLADPSTVAPRVADVTPVPGEVFALSNLTVKFTEPVSGVDAADLLINDIPAESISANSSNLLYTFTFSQPPYGPVTVKWAANTGIVDLDDPPKPFVPGSPFQFSLANPNAPTLISQVPVAGATVTNLSQVSITFSKPVTGLNASDLLVNGLPATTVTGDGSSWTFFFAQPAYGNVAFSWSSGHGITDLSTPANPFDATRPSATWSYNFLDQVPPVVLAKNPPAGASVTNLTQLAVTFSEAVSGVEASDLLINGVPASAVTGSGDTYTFSFAQPNATVVQVSWVNTHGIRDLAATPNNFNSASPGATWSYATPDTVAPGVLSISPLPYVTVRSLDTIRVTFTEPVTGVSTTSLLVNNQPARLVAGSGAGPYVFSFLPPASGPVEVRWAFPSMIEDFGVPPNLFPGGEWTYTLDPTADFRGKIVYNEIMFNPMGGSSSDEWVELKNVSTNLVNLTGWQFTDGVEFTFPNVSIPAGGYLVVAANVAAFQARYPGVTNVIGGWKGSLGNNGEGLELTTALGETVNSLDYATEGDWALRERGNGPSSITRITRNGSTATVTLFSHGFTGNDQVVITGADQPEYNGRFTISGITPSTFNITVAGSPATPATGAIAAHQVLDDGASGWGWFAPASGFGPSLELINPNLPNSAGANWLASKLSGGTPGQDNSQATNNIAPLIEDVIHSPAIPKSTDVVAITARVRDEQASGVSDVRLFFRVHSTTAGGNSPFQSGPMFDDGTHSDGLAGDGIYGAALAPNDHGTVIEFYVQATDASGLIRTWPAPSVNTNGPGGTFGTPGQYANALFQVDDEVVSNGMPVIRTVLTGTERAVFPPNNRNSDASMNCTLIATDGEGTEVRYLCDARVRGAGTRSRNPPNNRVNIPNDNPWNGRTAINLNSQYVHAQLLGNLVAAKAGLPTEEPFVVQYRINGQNPAPTGTPNGAGWGVFLLLKPVEGTLAEDIYPLDGDGNTYRASTGNHNADLNYLGTDPNSYLSRGVTKTSNKTENDWTDFMNLTIALSQVSDPVAYRRAVETNVNVQNWMTYFALSSLLNDGETKLGNGIGDDYAMYRGISDPRFVLFGHDYDTVFGQGDTGPNYYPVNTNSSIFVMLEPPNPNGNPATLQAVLLRFMTEYAPVFYAELKRISDTVLHPAEFGALVDQYLPVGGWVAGGPDANTVANIKSYAANRRSVVLSQIPLNLTISHTLNTAGGYPLAASPNVTLFGFSHAIDTRKVLVNGVQATWSPLYARWTNSVALQPGINRVLVQSLDSNNAEFARAIIEIWHDDGTLSNVSGTIASDTTWNAASGPYSVTGNLTVANGATLTIQPGTTVYLGSGVNITVASGGRLLAQGTEASPIRFTRTPGTATSWGGITINGGANSPETRISYAHFEGNASTAIHSSGGTVLLEHLSFGTTTEQYLSLDNSSFLVRDCVFPSVTADLEPVHGSGVKAGGRAIFLRNYFGFVRGYNDAVDFTGGNRPGGPIVQFINNVFMGSGDDILDLDGTDAWVEGNIFLNTHKNGSQDSASAVSGGSDSGQTSEVTVLGNIFYNVDQVANAKQGNFYTFYNNTVVRQTKTGGTDTVGAVALLADVGTAEGAGMYFEGNIFHDIELLVHGRTNAIVTFTNNILPLSWSGTGGGNVNLDPLLSFIPQPSQTSNFTSWAEAQVMWDWFSLRNGSPASGTGPGGVDKGAGIPRGVTISGVPEGTTSSDSASLRVGINRTGHGIPVGGFPNGSGFTHYKWRLDGGTWSAEAPITAPIILSSLSVGPHFVEVVGKRDSGLYQDDPSLGVDAVVSRTATWTVSPNAMPLRLNEILAANSGAFNHQGTTPDAIELLNTSDSELDLSGVRLTDDLENPDRFIFPQGTLLGAGEYLVLYGNSPDGTAGIHIGFGLGQAGDNLYLLNAVANGGEIIDSVTFGQQVENLSIGRLSTGEWALNVPTLGAANQGAPTGEPSKLRLNEWLALSQAPLPEPFLELYNLDSLPVDLGGLYLSDEPIGWPTRHQVRPLSFISGGGFYRFLASGDETIGPEHLSFQLDSESGMVALYARDLSLIDLVTYGPQWLNQAQGRSPNGGSSIVTFDQPTPGAPNPSSSVTPQGGALVINEILAANSSFPLLVGTNTVRPDWIELYNGSTNTVSLADLSLTDSTLVPRKYVFTGGTLAPGAFLRIASTSNLLPGTNNTGFSLRQAGGGVYLFDTAANGGGLLSSVVYGLQITDFSIGRSPDGSTNWVLNTPTPESANIPIVGFGNPADLKINEWVADPAQGESDWFELYNSGNLPLALGGLYLTDDLNNRTKHRIAPLSFIGFGTNAWLEFIADSLPVSGADHVNFSLRAAGEALGISAADGTLLDGVTFGAQEVAVSEGRFPNGNSTIVRFHGTDSPGKSNYRQLTGVAINEVLTHTDEPLEDAIELVNLTGSPIDISGWWLSDDQGTLQKYQIPGGTVLPAFGYKVIYEKSFTNELEAAVPFGLSSSGDEVVLSSAQSGTPDGYRVSVKFDGAFNGVSFGRYVTSEGRAEFVPMSARSFGVDDPSSVEQFRTGTGAPNPYPRVGPVVISQIMYHPPDLGTNDNTRDEYIQLRNTSTVAVPLYDTAYPTNTWIIRDAVDFDFPTGLSLPAGGTLLVVSFDPVNNPAALQAFRTYYGLTPATQIVGPWIGRLANNSDAVELHRPDSPNGDGVPYVLVEKVRYNSVAPWPLEPDGLGLSLHRISLTGFGNDPTNWVAGLSNLEPQGSELDSDNDGIPNAWETAFNLDPLSAADAGLDIDGDGLTNLQEYLAGTDPRNALSTLRLLSVGLGGAGTNPQLTFAAASNHAYSVLWKEAPAVGKWTKLVDVAAASVNRLLTINDPLPPAQNRIYRVVTPPVPGPVNPLPAILSSPRPALADVGENAEFSVFAVGNGNLSYQWLLNGNPVAWATGPVLTITNAQLADIGMYAVTVSNNGNQETSGMVPLSVRPNILTQPQSQSISVGGAVELTVVAQGSGPLTYRWFKDNQVIPGATEPTLTLLNAQPGDAGRYSVMVTHTLPWGKLGTRSSEAVLTVTQ